LKFLDPLLLPHFSVIFSTLTDCSSYLEYIVLRCDLHLLSCISFCNLHSKCLVYCLSRINLEILMVAASQLQLLQSPITALISSISTSVNVKLDESNYLNWNFQMQLLLESNGIMGYIDGLFPCPPQHCSISAKSGITSSSSQTNE